MFIHGAVAGMGFEPSLVSGLWDRCSTFTACPAAAYLRVRKNALLGRYTGLSLGPPGPPSHATSGFFTQRQWGHGLLLVLMLPRGWMSRVRSTSPLAE